MPRQWRFYVYVLASDSGVIYIGVTDDLVRRINEHRSAEGNSFTSRYKVHKLVYWEQFRYVNRAIAREKEIKGWRREKKVALIEEKNPQWVDQYELAVKIALERMDVGVNQNLQ